MLAQPPYMHDVFLTHLSLHPPRTATTETRPSYAGFTQTSWLPVVYKRAALLSKTAHKKHDTVGILTFML